jgi:PEP-CTERM motif
MTINLVSLASTGFDNTKYYSWTVLTSTGALTGTPVLGTTTGSDFSALGAGAFNLVTDSNTVFINFSPVPEPATIFAMSGLMGLGLAAYRRRNRVG